MSLLIQRTAKRANARLVPFATASSLQSATLSRRYASEVTIDPQSTPPVTSNVAGPKLTGWKKDALINVANLLGYSPRRTAAVRSTNHYYNMTSEIHDRHSDFWYNRSSLFPSSFNLTDIDGQNADYRNRSKLGSKSQTYTSTS